MGFGFSIYVSYISLISMINSIPVTLKRNPMLGLHYQGDILNPLKFKSRATSLSQKLPHKTLVYKISAGFSTEQQRLIFDAMNEIKSKTCVKFREASSWDRDYVVYTKAAQGCSAHVGKVGGQQLINLEPGCFYGGHGTVLHETIHALGFGHEHNRSDRDNFVNIYYDRIIPEYRYAFDKDTSNTFGVPYDYNSIMHYPKNAFAIRPLDSTMVPKSKEATIGQGQRLSMGDGEKLRRMYEC